MYFIVSNRYCQMLWAQTRLHTHRISDHSLHIVAVYTWTKYCLLTVKIDHTAQLHRLVWVFASHKWRRAAFSWIADYIQSGISSPARLSLLYFSNVGNSFPHVVISFMPLTWHCRLNNFIDTTYVPLKNTKWYTNVSNVNISRVKNKWKC